LRSIIRVSSCLKFQFYEGLSKRAADNGHVVDLFACSLDQVCPRDVALLQSIWAFIDVAPRLCFSWCSPLQVGTAEMKSMVEKTGGLIVLHDTFIHMVFAESFNRVFTRDAAHNELTMGFAAEISVATSR
jgi:protein transport protein SEC23